MNTATLQGKIEEMFKHGLIYGLTSVLQNLLGFIMLPVLTAFFTPDVFGAYSILLFMSTLGSSIFYLGASSAMGRFYFDENSDLFRKKIFTTALLITVFGAVSLSFIGIFFANNLSTQFFGTEIYTKPIGLIFLGTAFGILFNLMTLFLRYEQKSYQFFILMLCFVFIDFLLTYVLLKWFDMGISAPIFGMIISNALCFLVLLVKNVDYLTSELELKYVGLLLNFGLQTSIAGLLFYTLNSIDKLIIKELLNLSEVGVYSLGYRLGSVMNILLVVPFTFIWSPLRMKHSKDGDMDLFSERVLSYYTFVGVIIMMFAILFGEDIMKYFFVNKSYLSATKVFPVIMFAYLFYGYGNILDYGIYLHKKVYLTSLILILAIVFNVALNFFLIPKWGYMGAAYISVLTYLSTSITLYVISNRLHPLKVDLKRVLAALLFISFLYFLMNYALVWNLLYKLIVFFGTLYLFYRYWLSKGERKYILYKLIDVRRKIFFNHQT